MITESDGVYNIDVIGEDTEVPFAPIEDVFLNIVDWGIRKTLKNCIDAVDLLEYVEDKGDLFYDYDVETKKVNDDTEGSYHSTIHEVTAIIEFRDSKGDLVSEHRSVICRVSFDGNNVSKDNLVSINHRVERFVNEVVKHLSQ